MQDRFSPIWLALPQMQDNYKRLFSKVFFLGYWASFLYFTYTKENGLYSVAKPARQFSHAMQI